MRNLFVFVLPVFLFLSACQKNEYFVPNQTIVLNLQPSSWRSDNGGGTFYTIIDLPEITDDFNERGGVLTYVSFGDRTYEQLPQVYNGVSYSYTTRPGEMVIELQRAEGTGIVSPPSGIVTVKIILVDSDY